MRDAHNKIDLGDHFIRRQLIGILFCVPVVVLRACEKYSSRNPFTENCVNWCTAAEMHDTEKQGKNEEMDRQDTEGK